MRISIDTMMIQVTVDTTDDFRWPSAINR
jgi:hypothetical protein